MYSKELAEFIGILFGDGYINKYKKYNYVIEVSGHKEKDLLYHSKHIRKICMNVFNKEPKLTIRKNQNTLYSRIFSKRIFLELERLGMPRGKKKNLTIPSWIRNNKEFTIRFLRGLYDTDGSIILRKRNQNSISLSLSDENLINEVKCILEKMNYFVSYNKEVAEDKRGFTSVCHTIRINQKKLIRKFYKEIGSANPYKLKKLKKMGTPGFEPGIQEDTPFVASFT